MGSLTLDDIPWVDGQSAGAMAGGAGRKLLLHSTEGTTIAGAIAAYRARNVWPHLTVDMPKRQAVQHLPLDVAGRSLKNLPGGVETNRAGRYLVQIELVGFATDPTTLGTPEDLDWFGRHIVAPIHEATGIPLHTLVDWVPYPASYGYSARQRVPAARWADLSGVVGHQHAPENDHGDPGALDVDRILAAAAARTSPQPPKEIEMLIIDSEGRPALILGVGGVKRINTAQRGALRLAGIEAKAVTTAASDALWSLRDPAVVLDLDEPAIAALLAEELKTELGVVDDAAVEAAVRKVFADAGTAG